MDSAVVTDRTTTTLAVVEQDDDDLDNKRGNRKQQRKKKPNRVVIAVNNYLYSVIGSFRRSIRRNNKILLPSSLRRDRKNTSSWVVQAVWISAVLLIVGTIVFVIISVVIWIYKHAQCYSRELTVTWQEGIAHTMTRPCPPVNYPTLKQPPDNAAIISPNICITTLSDSNISTSNWQYWVRCRDFGEVATLTWPNMVQYARLHKYKIVDNSHLLDHTRPPAWSKILAVQNMMLQPHCEWVLWLDTDVIIMNSSITLESLLPADPNVHLIVTTDRRFTANSGVWLIRNSRWSSDFLNDWWNMKTWVRSKGLSLSGDNAAFGHLIRQHLGLTENADDPNEIETAVHASSHIEMPARCNMNSFGVFVQKDDDNIEKQKDSEWYMSDQFYHKGDFIAHASGIDQKSVGVEMLLKRAT